MWSAPLPLTAVALCVGLAAIAVTGAWTGLGQGAEIADPGAVTSWGLPVARFVHNMAMSAAVAAAILAATTVPPLQGRRRRSRKTAEEASEHPLFGRTLHIALLSSVVWTVSAVTVLVLTYSELAGQPLSSSDQFSTGFFGYVQSIPTGQAWMAVVLIAAIFATVVSAVRSTASLFFVSILGLAGIVPMALVGHSASGDDHTAAVNSLGLHLLGVVLWVGGLIVLLLLSPEIARQARLLRAGEQGGPEILGTLMRRYSVLAGLSLGTVAASGVVNASLRIQSWDQLLTTSYGVMISAKTISILALGAIGWMHREWVIPRLAGSLEGSGTRRSGDAGSAAPGAGDKSSDATSPSGSPGATMSRLLWQLVLVEVALMSAVVGISAILSRTSPPESEELPPDASPARLLTGYDLPPQPDVENWLTLMRPNWLWIAICVFLAIWYVRAMVRLIRRGDGWPIARTLSFLSGLVLLAWITSGGPAVYGMVLFSGHMVQHMVLTMVVPLFLVLGAPVTLALKSLPARTDGTRGAREWILWFVHSRFARVVAHPVVAAANFAGSIILFYYTPLFGLALEYHAGHELMNIHFILIGFIFAEVMIGKDPLPARPPHALRLVILLATMAFHAFVAVAMTSSAALIEASWFGNIGHDWGFSALEDQQRGGELMWGLGEIPTMVMAVFVAVQWSRDDRRETTRLDREADRTGDAELHEYNDMFERLATADRPADRPSDTTSERTPTSDRTPESEERP